MKTYRLRLDGMDVIFRELKLGEWGSLERYKVGNLSLYAKVVECALIQPSYVELRPGAVIYLGEKIFQISSKFSDELEASVSEIRKDIEESIHIIPALICGAFPAYTPEMVLEFDYETLVTRLAQVRWLNEQDMPKEQREGADPLQNQSINHNQGALQRELRKAKGRGAKNVT